ncbi:Nucleoporin Nup54, alpha-helical domain-containing protein [Rozella allomycis CSF55]|uniref:Nucleoporin Nup54, alpha-helical domain-containing protein n=1 Tax=Rozella allomycis (strain CSF55) TaxID=988480 RepID=A0A075ASN6_ROZAC|nr:Nucleoporin Nup54, alpha-helical domain-containing protein [Rozella allomycis CSF55]|eukprot:EPZ33296.1 Nucleoporin Nup54, alpha-helical domain-containing protein [Rozella allomycis CSF55]
MFSFGTKPSTNPPTNSNLSQGGTGFSFGANQNPISSTTNSGFNFGTTTSTAPNTSILPSNNTSINPVNNNTGFNGFSFTSTQPNATVNTSHGNIPTMDPNNPLHPLYLLAQGIHYQSPNCALKHILYNVVHPSEKAMYSKPVNMSERMWNQALKDSPDTSCMVPVLAVGVEDLQKRQVFQEKCFDLYQSKLSELVNKIDNIQRIMSVDTKTKIEVYKKRHLEISSRLLQLQVIKNKSLPLTIEEENLRKRLEHMSVALSSNANSVKVSVQELQVKAEMLKPQIYVSNNLNEDSLSQIHKVNFIYSKNIDSSRTARRDLVFD